MAAAETVLSAAAMQSKFLWGVRDTTQIRKRTQHLRRVLGIGARADALQNRDGRNAIEHLDEKMDEYFATNVGAVFVDKNVRIGVGAGIIGSESGELPQLRRIDDMTITILDKCADLAELMDAMQHVGECAVRWIKENTRSTAPVLSRRLDQISVVGQRDQ